MPQVLANRWCCLLGMVAVSGAGTLMLHSTLNSNKGYDMVGNAMAKQSRGEVELSLITQLLLSSYRMHLSHPWEIRARLGYGLSPA